MKMCPQCQKQLPDEAAFCDACGCQMNEMCACPQCHRQTAKAFPYCQNCGASLTATPVAAATPSVSMPPKKRSKKWLWIVLAILLVAALAVGAFLLFGKGGSKDVTKATAVYVKEGQLYSLDFAKGEGWQVTSKLADEDDFDEEDMASMFLGSRCFASNDGKYLFYPDKLESPDDDVYSLYVRRLDKQKEEPVKISSDVTSYIVTADGSVVTFETDKAVYQYVVEKQQKEKVTDEYDTIRVSADKKTVYFTDEEDGRLYRKTVGKDKVKIDSDVAGFTGVSEDGETVYYIKDDALFKKTGDAERVKIDSDVYNAELIYDSGEIYYTKETEGSTLYDFVNDDLKTSDAQMTKVEYPSCPYFWEFNSDAAYKAAYAQYEKKKEAYYAYEEKLERDELRDSLKDEKTSWGYDLYYYNGSKGTKVAENVSRYGVYGAQDKPVILYRSLDVDTVKKVKLSSLTSFSTASDTIDEALDKANQRFVAAGSTISEFEYSDAISFEFTEDGSKLYFLDNVSEKSGDGDLCYVELKDGKSGKAVKYDEDVHDFSIYGDNVYCEKDYSEKNHSCELYMNKNKVDTDVYSWGADIYILCFEDGDLLYFTDVSEKNNSGTLKVYKDGKSVKIADDVLVSRARVDNDGNVLYLADYSGKNYTGDLYRWHNEKAEKIDEDVSDFYPVFGNYHYNFKLY